jgi:hypothetical protein
MIKIFGPVATAAVMFATAAMPAAAKPAKGYQITYSAGRDHYCVRPLSLSEAERLGIAPYKTECHSAAAWKTMGLLVSRG